MYRTMCYVLLLSIVEAVDKGSLTFVIDHTASMAEEIDKVKIAARDIANNIFNKAESEVQNIVLVTFDDPTAISSDGNYVRLMTKTTNFDEFKRNLESISLVGNSDCPEMCLSGTLKGLQESDHGSLVYVFADDSPKDVKWAGRDLFTEVMSAGQKNEHQIVFIITPRPSHCRNDGRDFMSEIQPYYEIAAATNGQVFNLDGKTEVGEILEYVKETISGQRTVIISKIIPADVWENVPFTIDDKTEYGIISTSGKAVELLLHESPVNAILTHVTWLRNAKVAKVSIAGNYVVKVKGGGVTSIVVFGRTDFVFQFGFSRTKPSSLSETSKQPIAGKQYYLLIQIEDKEGDVGITSIELINTRNDLLLRVPVKMINDKIYLSELLLVPGVTFKIEVLGMTKRGIIRRANRTPINPVLSPDPDESPKIDKKVTHSPLRVQEGTNSKLSCHIIGGKPDPIITWYVKGTAKSNTEELELSPATRTDTGSYQCVATNKLGSDSYNIDLVVTYPPSITSKVTLPENVEVGKIITLPCEVDSYPVSTIKWFFNGVDITKDPFYQIDVNNMLSFTAATINSGEYTCEATNELSTAKKIQKLFIYEKPRIDKSEKDIIAEEGQKASIKCRVTSTPEATIKWYINGVLTTITDATIDITPVNRKNTGSYKCEATNNFGDDTHTTNLTVWYPPNITSKITVLEKFEVGKIITLPCEVDSYPVSTIKWFFNGVDITKDPFYQIDVNNMLSFTAALINSGEYTCEATNKVSTAKKIQKVFVYEKPRIDKSEKDIIAKEGQKALIKCRVTSTPEATIKWYINGVLTTITDATIDITPANRKNTGSYKCVAKNEFGEDTYNTYLTVWYPPSFITKATRPKEIEIGQSVSLSCEVDSLPISTIRWLFNGVDVAGSTSLYIDPHHKLSFKAGLHSTGDYICEATNDVETATLMQRVFVYETPIINKKVREVIVVEGDNALVECPISVATPKPKIHWRVKLNHGKSKTYDKDFIQLNNICSSDAGYYVCEANNGYGSDTHSVHVIVNYLPKVNLIVLPNKAVAQGTLVQMRCVAEGYPDPHISWYINGREIVNDKKYSIKTQTYTPDLTSVLRFEAKNYVEYTGKYTCKGSNSVGDTSVNEDFFVYVPVEIQPPIDSKPDVMVGNKFYLHCNSIGYPKPDHKWSYCTEKPKKCEDVHNIERQFSNGTILLKNTALEDSGNYICNASNLYSYKQVSYNLSINSAPLITKTDDVIDIEAVTDDLVLELPCKASGYPQPEIKWKVYGKLLPSAPDETINSEGTLRIKDVQTKHSGFYICEVRNIHGFDQVSYNLDVVNYAKPVPSTTTVHLRLGESRDIACNVPHANDITIPRDKVRWYQGSKIVSSEKKIYRIENAAFIGSTKYTCRVSYWNKIYSETATIRVIVAK